MDEAGASTSPRLRIGLLVDSERASKYILDFVNWAQTQQDLLTVTHLILHPKGAGADKANILAKLAVALRSGRLYRVLSNALFHLVVKIDNVLLSRNSRHRDHLECFDLSHLVAGRIIIEPIVSKSGLVYRFSAADIDKIKAVGFDLLIRCGSGILRGDILNAAKFGVVSFHHGDNRINRGGPAGFWEVYFRQDTTGFIIQRLTEELDGGDVLFRGHVATSYHYLLNQAVVFERSNFYLKSLIGKIAHSGQLPEIIPSVPYSNRLFRTPTAFQSCIYLIALFAQLAGRLIRNFFEIHHRWHVGYVYSDWRSAVLRHNMQLKNPPWRYLADPFVVSRGNQAFCFVEDFDFRTRKGNIAVYELTRAGGVLIGTALEEKFHLSFPYIFEYQNELYMCPESASNRDIRLYKCVEFPLRWQLVKVMMEDLSAADTMLFEKNGKWWIFTNTDSARHSDYCLELSIFHSDSLFSDRWVPHARNPILVDAARARNAGLVRDGDSLFRISQGQGFDLYGKTALINEITELTESNYTETIISANTAGFSAGVIGTHHMHSDGNITVFDFVTNSRIKS